MTKQNSRGVIFDLDGTLLDTLADLAAAVNRALAGLGFAPHAIGDYRLFVGDGARVLITRCLPESQRSPQLIDQCLAAFIADYLENWDCATKPYDGVLELIQALQQKNIPMAVVTNKPHQFTDAMIARYYRGIPFDPVYGQRDGIPKKPDPQQTLKAADKMGISPDHCLFVGDSAVDMQTAIGAGMKAIGVTWGFRSKEELAEAGADAIIDHPSELLRFIA